MLILGSCNSYYLQNVKSDFSIPNTSPVLAINRKKGLTRLSADIVGSFRPQVNFNDGHHSNVGNDSGNNVHIQFPNLQGAFSLDYDAVKHLFFFGKLNMCYIDDHLSGALNAGIGAHFNFRNTSFQGYISPVLYYLHSSGIVMIYENSFVFGDQGNPLIVNNYTNKELYLGLGGGFQFSMAGQKDKLHLLWGLDLQLQKYFSFTYTQDQSNYLNYYYMIFLTPNVGISRSFGNSQVDMIGRWGIPVFSKNSELDAPIDLSYPTLTLSYTYCFGKY